MELSTQTLEKIAYESDDPAIIDAVFGAIDNAQGNYDSEKAKDALRKLSASGILDYKNAGELKKLFISYTSKKGEDYDNPPSISLKDIASKLGYETTEEMLDGEVPWSKIPYDRYKDEFGERTDEVRDVLKQASMDYAYNVKTPQLQNEAVNASGMGGVLDILVPRMTASWRKGQGASASDIFGDLAENALMAVPSPASLALKGARAIPRVGRVLAKVGSKVPSTASKIAVGTVADNAVVPALMEGYDALVYDDDNPRGVFNPADVIRGWAVNWGTPAFLRSMLEGVGRFGGGFAGSGGGMQKLFEKLANPKNPASAAAVSYGTNKLGDEKYGKAVISSIPVIGPVLDEKVLNPIDEAVKIEVENLKDEKSKAMASDILGGAGLTAEDRKFLKMIKEKPSIVKLGIPGNKDADRFNMWLMTRGNELGVTRPGWAGVK